MAFAQEPRLAVGAAVAEGRKHQRDRGQPIEIGHEIVEIAIVRPDHAELAGARQNGRDLRETRRRNQDRAVARQFGAVGDMNEQVGGDFAFLTSGIDPLLEWFDAQPLHRIDEQFLGTVAQREIGFDDVFDHVGNFA